ncbi:endoplasmic reticulum membrane sensor NFE2L1-like isoform X2 [Ptychodera flava]|uniref:endoplasmic reticulum membrane sensor NFE2L1-like isoform X2 n=1 Tax=Ptychodera flava TaxID=63121 RepID=UPI00396AA613
MTTVAPIRVKSEDMDLIDVLWKQDIDMGVCREIYDGSYRQKELEKEKQLELERQKEVEKVDEWAGIEYRVDSETGEYIPLTPQPASLTSAASESGRNTALDVDMIDYNLDECIQMLREHARQQNNVNDMATLDEEGMSVDGDSSSSSLPSPDFEQQWQDLASLPELQQFDLAAIMSQSVNNSFAAGGTQPSNDTYAVNATTNGNVNLQNATIPSENITNLLQSSSILSPTSTFENLRISSPGMENNTAVANFSMDFPESNNNMNVSFGGNANNNATDSLLSSLVSDAVLEEIGMMGLSMDEGLATLTNLDVAEAAGDSPPSEDRDSAVSVNSGSVSGSISDLNETMSLSSLHRDSSEDDGIDGDSLYGDIEGATAGDINIDKYFSNKKQPLKDETQYEKYQRMSSEPPSMDHIKHNHTYPQPSDSDEQQDGSSHGSGDWHLESSSSKKDRKGQKFSRDEKKAKSLGIPISNDKIIDLPVDEFNELLSKYELTEPQLALIRDIRRRGKNKIAAQFCRKRKLDAIVGLEDEVESMRAEKDRLRREQRMIDKETTEMKDRFQILYREVFESLRDESGEPYDPQEYSLQQSTDGNVFLVPNTAIAAATAKNCNDHKHKSKNSRKKGNSK